MKVQATSILLLMLLLGSGLSVMSQLANMAPNVVYARVEQKDVRTPEVHFELLYSGSRAELIAALSAAHTEQNRPPILLQKDNVYDWRGLTDPMWFYTRYALQMQVLDSSASGLLVRLQYGLETGDPEKKRVRSAKESKKGNTVMPWHSNMHAQRLLQQHIDSLVAESFTADASAGAWWFEIQQGDTRLADTVLHGPLFTDKDAALDYADELARAVAAAEPESKRPTILRDSGLVYTSAFYWHTFGQFNAANLEFKTVETTPNVFELQAVIRRCDAPWTKDPNAVPHGFILDGYGSILARHLNHLGTSVSVPESR